MNKRELTLISLLVIAIIGLISVTTWINYQISKQNSGGVDFFISWRITRAFLFDGVNPYDDNLFQQIEQQARSQIEIKSNIISRWKYPLYTLLFYIPFSFIEDFPLARAIWMTINEIIIIALALLGLNLSEWKPKRWFFPLYIVFCLFLFHSVNSLLNGNIIILTTVIVFLTFFCLKHDFDEVAGAILSLCIYHFQAIALLLGFIFLWAFKNRKWHFIGWFFGMHIFFTIASFAFLPNWLTEFFRVNYQNPGNPLFRTPGVIFYSFLPGVGRQLGWILTLIITTMLLIEWWLARDKEFRWMYWAACLTLALAQWIGIPTSSDNFVLLLPTLPLLLSINEKRWVKSGNTINLSIMGGLLFGLWIIYFLYPVPRSLGQIPSALFFPLPLIAITGLYWIRWWVLSPPKSWLEVVREQVEQ
jgi:hypothetical protein